MPKLITETYRRLNKNLHSGGRYGLLGYRMAPSVLGLCDHIGSKEILDYGCGQRTLEKELGFEIKNYDPAIEGIDQPPEPADIVVCGDVLEHIEPELLDNVLDDLKRVTKVAGLFIANTVPAKKFLEDGRNAHLIQENKDWWEERLKKRFHILSSWQIENNVFFVVMSNAEWIKRKPSVAFLHVGEDTTLPEIMVASVNKWMPDTTIIQMTDLDTPEVPGVSMTRRLKQNCDLMLYRLKHLAALNGNNLILDTDVVLLSDVGDVFSQKFDVCLTKRHKNILVSEAGNVVDTPMMPYNTGVMFSRNQEFWREATAYCKTLPDKYQRWLGDQVSVAHIAKDPRFTVMELDCDIWNYTPKEVNEDLTGKRIVHYKGLKKKEWMKAA